MNKKVVNKIQFIILSIAIVSLFFINYLLMEWIYETVFAPQNVELMHEVENRAVFLKKPYDTLRYEQTVEPRQIRHLNLVGKENRHGVYAGTEQEQLIGKTMRTLRYTNISKKVEKKYGLPKNIILAMVMQETGGLLILPNARNDGGVGLCHMQPYTASKFDLKIYNNNTKMQSFVHGRRLRSLIIENDSLVHKLVAYDDRFNPVKNLDAAGRMLAYYMRGEQIETTKLQTAIRRYAGRYNYHHYYQKVMYYQEKLNDKQFIMQVRKRFNRINPNLTIGGEKANFQDYLEYFRRLNLNFGLDKYW